MRREQLLRLVGRVPTDPWGRPIERQHECAACGETVSELEIAWDTLDFAPDEGMSLTCISCAVSDALASERAARARERGEVVS